MVRPVPRLRCRPDPVSRLIRLKEMSVAVEITFLRISSSVFRGFDFPAGTKNSGSGIALNPIQAERAVVEVLGPYSIVRSGECTSRRADSLERCNPQ